MAAISCFGANSPSNPTVITPNAKEAPIQGASSTCLHQAYVSLTGLACLSCIFACTASGINSIKAPSIFVDKLAA